MVTGMLKLTMRQIRSSLTRFLAIAAIVALGVGFFCGLRLTKTAMVHTLDDYAEAHRMYDFRLVSTVGFDETDAEALAAGELGGEILHPLAEADLPQHLVCRDGIFTKLTRDLHVFQRRHIGKQIIKLEHKADLVPAVGRQPFAVKPRHILARQQHMAGGQPVHASENV